MVRSFYRFLYRGFVGLHPSAFKARFGEEMLWIFDEVSAKRGVTGLFGDALVSLGRQWAVTLATQNELAWPSPAHDLFAWDRIASPTAPLPVSRIVQGSFVSFSIVAILSLLAISVGQMRPFCGDTSGVKNPATVPQQLHGRAYTAKHLAPAASTRVVLEVVANRTAGSGPSALKRLANCTTRNRTRRTTAPAWLCALRCPRWSTARCTSAPKAESTYTVCSRRTKPRRGVSVPVAPAESGSS